MGFGAKPQLFLVRPIQKESQQGAGSEASLPVTSRVLRRASKPLFSLTVQCRAKWARPQSRNTHPSNSPNQPHITQPSAIPASKSPKPKGDTKLEIKKAEFITSMAQYGKFEGVGLPQIAVAGKSNVGKSSLINKLCNRRSLARTSQTPGKTRLINAFLLNDSFHLIDLPGYGFAKVDKQEKLRWGKMMQDYFEQSDELRHVLCLVDIRHEPTEDDKQMNLFLRQMGIPFTVIATKADKISRGARQKQLAPICRALLVQPWEVICWSSEDGTGRDRLLTLLEKVLAPEEEAPEA
ncbi:MAG: ribosome biogenesis GTP-binding protein YihA/YsxC [Faecalibacterium sp.]|nr:ribosome biogenesis GTP-binding protein YihA/YsxC [Faecalibacterium sp.]